MNKSFGENESILYLDSLGIPHRLSVEWTNLVHRWETESGAAWTIDRLKSLKVDLLRTLDGLSPIGIWKKNRLGVYSGPVGALFNMMVVGSPQTIHQALNMVMIYSRYIATEPSSANIADLKNNLSAKLDSDCYSLCSDIALLFHFDNEISIKDTLRLSHILDWRGSDSKRAPINRVETVEMSKSIFLDHPELRLHRAVLKDIAPTVMDEFLKNISYPLPIVSAPVSGSSSSVRWNKWVNPGIFHKMDCGNFAPKPRNIGSHVLQDFFNPPKRPIVGKISALFKDQSMKVRWIASPLRSYQLMLKPMGDALFNVLKELPWDCTFDQNKGVVQVQKWLQEGRTCYSFDLKSATDYLPLRLQMMVFNRLSDDPIWKELCALFHWVATGDYICKQVGGTMRWHRGQPMGLYPSFCGLALGHAAIAHYACRNGSGDFRILGDDIVIVGDTSAQLYRKVMETLGCKISEKKTLVSNTTAEFAGKVIRADAVYNCVKWKAFDDDNFVQKLIMLGNRFEKFLTPRQKIVFNDLRALQPPYGTGSGVDLELSIMLTDLFVSALSVKDPIIWDPRPLSGAKAQGISDSSLFVRKARELLEYLDERIMGWLGKEDILRSITDPEVFSTFCRLRRITPSGLPIEQKRTSTQSTLTILQKTLRKLKPSGSKRDKPLPLHTVDPYLSESNPKWVRFIWRDWRYMYE
jgi:hypothetical protein